MRPTLKRSARGGRDGAIIHRPGRNPMGTCGGCHVEPVERGDVDESELEEAAPIYLAVSDMGCPNCAHRVRNALLAVPGVLDAAVHLGAGQAAVACRGGSVGVDDLVGAVEDASQGTRHRYTADVLRIA